MQTQTQEVEVLSPKPDELKPARVRKLLNWSRTSFYQARKTLGLLSAQYLTIEQTKELLLMKLVLQQQRCSLTRQQYLHYRQNYGFEAVAEICNIDINKELRRLIEKWHYKT